MVVRIRFCPSCGEVLNKNIVSRKCPEDTHAKMRRSRNSYCMDCGTGLLERAGDALQSLAAAGAAAAARDQRERGGLREPGRPAAAVRAHLAPDQVAHRHVEHVARRGRPDPRLRAPEGERAEREDGPVQRRREPRGEAVHFEAEPHLDVADLGHAAGRAPRGRPRWRRRTARAPVSRAGARALSLTARAARARGSRACSSPSSVERGLVALAPERGAAVRVLRARRGRHRRERHAAPRQEEQRALLRHLHAEGEAGAVVREARARPAAAPRPRAGAGAPPSRARPA